MVSKQALSVARRLCVCSDDAVDEQSLKERLGSKQGGAEAATPNLFHRDIAGGTSKKHSNLDHLESIDLYTAPESHTNRHHGQYNGKDQRVGTSRSFDTPSANAPLGLRMR